VWQWGFFRRVKTGLQPRRQNAHKRKAARRQLSSPIEMNTTKR
jgi:hypothetical protein